MKKDLKILFSILFLISVSSILAANNKSTDGGNEGSPETIADTNLNIKTNIYIFRIINTPAPATPPQNKGGSLKKAGKVARTSNYHSSLDTIIYFRKGI
jgi:hypothetical protein